MAKNNVPGRLNREQNPRPGQPEPGFNSQFYDKDGYATDVDENNPYPVANYALHGNIWLPVSEDNPMPTRLTGSNVAKLTQVTRGSGSSLPSDTTEIFYETQKNTRLVKFLISSNYIDNIIFHLYIGNPDGSFTAVQWLINNGYSSTSGVLSEFGEGGRRTGVSIEQKVDGGVGIALLDDSYEFPYGFKIELRNTSDSGSIVNAQLILEER